MHDVEFVEQAAMADQLAVEAAQGRALVAGHEGGRAFGRPAVDTHLVHGDSHQRLHPGEEERASLLTVFGVQIERSGGPLRHHFSHGFPRSRQVAQMVTRLCCSGAGCSCSGARAPGGAWGASPIPPGSLALARACGCACSRSTPAIRSPAPGTNRASPKGCAAHRCRFTPSGLAWDEHTEGLVEGCWAR